MCGFLTRLVENIIIIIIRHENFVSTNWYNRATALISAVLVTLFFEKMIQCHGIASKPNQNQQAKSCQVRYKVQIEQLELPNLNSIIIITTVHHSYNNCSVYAIRGRKEKKKNSLHPVAYYIHTLSALKNNGNKAIAKINDP